MQWIAVNAMRSMCPTSACRFLFLSVDKNEVHNKNIAMYIYDNTLSNNAMYIYDNTLSNNIISFYISTCEFSEKNYHYE